MEKLYVYVDETGQDTEGTLFVVVAIVTQGQRQQIEQFLETVEVSSGKAKRKWHRTPLRSRKRYFERVFAAHALQAQIFTKAFHNGKNYLQWTATTVELALRAFAVSHHINRYRSIVAIDALNEVEKHLARKLLSEQGVEYVTVRGGRDETSALLRLADAIAGLVRQDMKGNPTLTSLKLKAEKHGFLYHL